MMKLPRHEFIIESLLKEIRSGRYHCGDKVPSEYELAARFKVNKTTINKALAMLVARGYLRRAGGAAGTIVIRDNAFPAGTLVFWMMGGHGISYFWKILVGAQRGAAHRGYMVWPLFAPAPLGAEREFWANINQSGAAGIIAVGLDVPAECSLPVMYVDQAPPDKSSAYSVNSDNEAGGYMMGRHLAEMGHRDMVFVMQWKIPAIIQRSEGFCRALQETGIPDAHKRIIHIPCEENSMELGLRKVLRNFPKLTAIAFDCDPSAVTAMKYFDKAGIKIPGDMSITGFAFVAELNMFRRLTTIDQHPLDMGNHAADCLVDIIEKQAVPCHHDKVPVDLVRGETVAAPRHS